jgi:hypothetical protein
MVAISATVFHHVNETGEATVELGYATRSIKETLTDAVNWLKEQGRI